MPEYYFGEILLEKGLITADQLAEALSVQEEKPYLRLGEALLSLGHLSIDQLNQELERLHRDIRIGQILLHAGIVTGLELERALQLQERSGEMLGEILLSLGYCTQGQLDRALVEQNKLRRIYETIRQLFAH